MSAFPLCFMAALGVALALAFPIGAAVVALVLWYRFDGRHVGRSLAAVGFSTGMALAGLLTAAPVLLGLIKGTLP